MAKFEAKNRSVFQLPEETQKGNSTLGFCICTCDNGADVPEDDARNAQEIARCLNQDEAIKDLAAWLLKQKTLHLNAKRKALLAGIVNGNQ